jgi:hypothetical protein
MKAAKVAKLFQLKFIRDMEEGVGSITREHVRRSRPTLPVPPHAKVVGVLPKKFKEFLALTLLLQDRQRAASEICAGEAHQGRTPRFDILRMWTDLAHTANELFWACLRAEMPPPDEFAYEEGIIAALGPNFEVYYSVSPPEERPYPVRKYTEVEQSGSRVLH